MYLQDLPFDQVPAEERRARRFAAGLLRAASRMLDALAERLALVEALDPLPVNTSAQGLRLGLKWPNDLWLTDAAGRGRKLGGVLIETVSAGQGRLCVVGVGQHFVFVYVFVWGCG